MKKHPRENLLRIRGMEALLNDGLSHAYELGEESLLQQALCFEKNGQLRSIIKSHGDEITGEELLIGIMFTFTDRIEKQDYVYSFITGDLGAS